MLLQRAMTVVAVAFLLGFIPLARSAGLEGSTLTQQVSKMVADIRSGLSSRDRTDAAEHLFEITRGNESNEVSDEQLTQIISLLKNSDDSVRYWVARCLGNFGRRAKPAVPELQKILDEVDCINAPMTSASGIRIALKQIGVKPPRSKCNWRRILQ